MGSTVKHSPAKGLFQALPGPLQLIARSVQDRARRWQAERAVAAFRRPEGRPHGLPGELVVTLTSFPPRYHCLRKTIVSLLMQDVRPDRTVLWLATGAENHPPPEISNLQSFGLEIRFCDDLRSFKKIIPSLEVFPDAYLVTADDDLYYESDWLRKLLDGFDPSHPAIVCRRAHRPKLERSRLAPYGAWDHDIVSDAIEPCIFPTTGHGVLYPPGSLAPEVAEREVFLELCPHADDVWLFVMALRAGSHFRQVGGGCPQTAWETSQSTSLMHHNLGSGGNDRQLSAVLTRYAEGDRLSAILRSLSSNDGTAGAEYRNA